jgi:hypothetical protein
MEATAFRRNDRNPVPLFAAKLQVLKKYGKAVVEAPGIEAGRCAREKRRNVAR